jgi:tetratricopeptide (TPR) repeat protein
MCKPHASPMQALCSTIQGTRSCQVQEEGELSIARVMLANCLHTTHAYEEALSYYETSLPLVRSSQGNTHLVRAALSGQAHCLLKLRNLEQAVATFQKASLLYQEAGNLNKSEESIRGALQCQQLVVHSYQHGQDDSAAAALTLEARRPSVPLERPSFVNESEEVANEFLGAEISAPAEIHGGLVPVQ